MTAVCWRQIESTSLSPSAPVLHSTFIASTPAADLNTTYIASTDTPPVETPDTAMLPRKRTLEVEDLPPAKRISRKRTIREFVAPKPPQARKCAKGTKLTSTGAKKQHASLMFDDCDG